MWLIMSADSERYSGICDEFNNSNLLGTENDPKTPTAACDVLLHYNNLALQRQVHKIPGAVTLVQSEKKEKKQDSPRK